MSENNTLEVESVDAVSRRPPVAGLAVVISAAALLVAAYAVYQTQRWA